MRLLTKGAEVYVRTWTGRDGAGAPGFVGRSVARRGPGAGGEGEGRTPFDDVLTF
jgi:hypothetical protein